MPTKLQASKYSCPQCGSGDFAVTTTRWTCNDCGRAYSCAAGIPRLYIDEALGAQDRKLRDTLYNGLFGKLYQVTMPAIVMPVRPWSMSWPYWMAFSGVWMALIALAWAVVWSVNYDDSAVIGVLAIVALAVIGLFLARQRYLLH